MSDSVDPVKDDTKFPVLANGPALFYDEDRGECWFGIPFEKIADPHLVVASFDRAKYDALLNLQKFHQSVARRQALKGSGVLDRLGHGLKSAVAPLINRLGGK